MTPGVVRLAALALVACALAGAAAAEQVVRRQVSSDHLSLTGKRQPAEARDSLLQLLGTFRVEDKD